MTNAEVLNVVQLEIAPRYRKLDDTVRGDWARAVRKCPDLDTARQIIRAIVDDPAATLSVKTFYRKLRESGKAAASGRDGVKYRLRYSAGDDGEPFRVYAVRREPTPWIVTLSYPTARLYADGVVVPIDWTEDQLREAMFRPLSNVKGAYGGEWILEIAHARPDADAEFRRRWAPKAELKSVPAEPPRQTVAPRGELERLERAERLCKPEKKPLKTDGKPLVADADWFDAESAKLAAEEQPLWAQPVDGAGPEDEF